ncbi:hypothetical protein [uncultured Bosea sp.]|uniref:hypothetical protein n=1 Tax=uncultured Bosea sp. TaxID=211457 RepID=UPI0025EE700F|nr:hypothetical protein [uncultured Bosea sp.]
MAIDSTKLKKILALVDSGIEAESLAALRMARKLLAANGMDLVAVIEAGVNALAAQPEVNPYAGAFDDILARHARPTQAWSRAHHAPR